MPVERSPHVDVAGLSPFAANSLFGSTNRSEAVVPGPPTPYYYDEVFLNDRN
jgi:hypothetical protein